jgi:DNA-binding NarL/FixJ family response regulator
MIEQVFALSRDRHWLGSVDQVCRLLGLAFAAIDLAEGLRASHPGEKKTTLVLLDGADSGSLIDMTSQMVRAGWTYTVAVVARPDWREARAVLGPAGAYDYWSKSYNGATIQGQLRGVLNEQQALHASAPANGQRHGTFHIYPHGFV